MSELLVDDTSTDDRRPLVGVGMRRGTDVVIADWQATAQVGVRNIAQTVIATCRTPCSQPLPFLRARSGAGRVRFTLRCSASPRSTSQGTGAIALVMFDIDDVDAAFAELDARYLAGEAAEYAHTWSVIADG